MNRSWHERALGRFLLEYVGNLNIVDSETPNAPTPAERRNNHHGRKLVDWFKKEMTDRDLPTATKAELLNRMRDVVRTGEMFHPDSGLAEEVDRE